MKVLCCFSCEKPCMWTHTKLFFFFFWLFFLISGHARHDNLKARVYYCANERDGAIFFVFQRYLQSIPIFFFATLPQSTLVFCIFKVKQKCVTGLKAFLVFEHWKLCNLLSSAVSEWTFMFIVIQICGHFTFPKAKATLEEPLHQTIINVGF